MQEIENQQLLESHADKGAILRTYLLILAVLTVLMQACGKDTDPKKLPVSQISKEKIASDQGPVGAVREPEEPPAQDRGKEAVLEALAQLEKDQGHFLYSVDPGPKLEPSIPDQGKSHEALSLFGYPVLGKLELSRPSTLNFISLLRQSLSFTGPVASCFNPRHLLIGERGFGLLICFECSRVEAVTRNPKDQESALDGRLQAPISSQAEGPMNQLLTLQKIPIAK